MTWKSIIPFLSMSLIGLQVPELCAVQTGDSMNITFTGHLMVRRSCTVNNDQVINVAFGTVAADDVPTGEIVKPVDYTLNCVGVRENNSVEMTIKASAVNGHPATMSASQSALWVTFLNDGQEQPLNTPFVVPDWKNPPKIDIRLDKDPDQGLRTAAFTATATLMAEYF